MFWSVVDEMFLIEVYPYKKIAEISKLMNRDENDIKSFANKIGLKKLRKKSNKTVLLGANSFKTTKSIRGLISSESYSKFMDIKGENNGCRIEFLLHFYENNK